MNIKRALIFFFCLWAVLNNGMAQHNVFRIHDDLYPLYDKASRIRNSKESLAMADKLFREAGKLGDKKAQCLALTIPVVYYSGREDMAKLQEASDSLKSFSRRTNFLQYYYYACNTEITTLLRTNRSFRALEEMKEMNRQAIADNYPYGIATSLRMMGSIYQMRGDRHNALKYYQQALDYSKDNVKDQELTSCYRSIAMCYKDMKRYEEAFDYIEKAAAHAKTEANQLFVRYEKCLLLYNLGRLDEFEKLYQELMRDGTNYGESQKEQRLKLGIYYNVVHQNYGKAHEICDSVVNVLNRNKLHRMTYNAEGKQGKAYQLLQWEVSYIDSLYHQISLADMSELSARLDNQQLKQQTLDLQRKEAENQIVLQRIELAGCLLLILFLIVILGLSRMFIRKIKNKNKELVVARNRAEVADQMKSSFIQNMSHEIRTPLNAIVGFAQLLTDPSIVLPDSDRLIYSNQIKRNSDLLTTLISDILSLSELESGAYKVNREAVGVNSVCNMALSTVKHRKAENVRLYYTSEVDDLFTIHSDSRLLEQVFINLLTNAEKHTEEGEIHLHCSLSEHPGKITFSVTDTGCGVPAEQAEKIFERFKKLDDFKQGTGLGLNICRVIAEKMQGQVMLDNSYTGGARFLFILPLE